MMNLHMDIELDKIPGLTASTVYKDEEFEVSFGNTVATHEYGHTKLAIVRWTRTGISLIGTESLFPEVFKMMKVHPKWNNGCSQGIPKYKIKKGALKALVLKKIAGHLAEHPEMLEYMLDLINTSSIKDGRRQVKDEFRDWIKEN
jgi:hypothetical protein